MAEDKNTQLDIAAFKDMFATEKGKRVLDNLAKHCLGYDELVIFNVNSARLTDFNLGKNDVYRHIMWMLKRKTQQEERTTITKGKTL